MWRLRTALQDQLVATLVSAVAIPLILLPLTPRLTAQPWLLFLAAVVVVVVLVGARVVAWLRRRTQPLVTDAAFDARWRGMVFSLSTGPYDTSVCRTVLERQTEVTHVGLLASRALAAKPELATYRQALDRRGMSYEVQVCDEQDLDDIARKVSYLLDWLDRQGVPRSAAAVDLTQGTTPMSLGAYLAATAAGVACQYIASEVRPDGSRDRSLPVRGLLLSGQT